MSISKVKFTKIGNMIILILIFIIVITCYNCFFSVNGLGTGANQLNLIEGFTSEEWAAAETDVATGNAEYIQSITDVSDIDYNLTQIGPNLQSYIVDDPTTFDGFDKLRTININYTSMPVVFTIINEVSQNINKIYYADNNNDIHFFDANNPSTTFEIMTSQPLPAGASITNLKYLNNTLICIANNIAYQSALDLIYWSPYTTSLIDIYDLVATDRLIYYINILDKYIYYVDYTVESQPTQLNLGINVFFQNIEIDLEGAVPKIYALSELLDQQSLYVISLTTSDFTVSSPLIYVEYKLLDPNITAMSMALNITSTLNDNPNNKIYYIARDQDNGNAQLNDASLMSPESGLLGDMIDDLALINSNNQDPVTIRINKMNNYIYLLHNNQFYTIPLYGKIGTNNTVVDYVNEVNTNINNMNPILSDLSSKKSEANLIMDKLNNSAKIDWDTDLSGQVHNLDKWVNKLKNIREFNKDITGNIGEQNTEYNMVYIKYIFLILISIITIILLVINYITPDVITTELVIAYITIIVILIYINRIYISRYLTKNFDIEQYFSKKINPVIST